MSDEIELDDDFELDDDGDFDLDFDSPFSEPPPPKDTREAVSRSINKVGSSFMDEFTDDKVEVASEMVKASIPKRLSTEASGYGSVVDSFKKDLNTSGTEIKNAAIPMIKAVESFVPEGGRLESFMNLAKEKLGMNEEERTSEDIAADAAARAAGSVAEVLGEFQDKETAKDAINAVIQNKKDLSNIELQAGMAGHLEAISNFNIDVTNAFYRKSLELQYRHLFTANEQLDITKQGFETFKNQLESIVANSALPDLVKTKNSEFMKHRLLERAGESLFARTGVFDSLKKKLSAEVQGVTSIIANGMTGLGDAADMVKSTAEMSEMAGGKEGMLGSLMAGGVKGFVGNKIGDIFGKTAIGKKGIDLVKDLTMDMSGTFDNLAENREDGLLKNIFSGLSSFTSNEDEERSFGINKIDRDGVALFDGKVHTSITKIIPSLLSKILKEVSSSRSGNEEEELRFDYDTGSFKTKSDISDNLTTKLDNKLLDSGTTFSIDRILNDIDKEIKLNLSEEELADIKENILMYTINGKSLNPKTLEKNGFYDDLNPELADKFKTAIDKYLNVEDDKLRDTRVSFLNKELNNIKTNAPSPQDILESYDSSGSMDVLVDKGFVKLDEKTGDYKLDKDNYRELLGKSVRNIKDKEEVKDKEYKSFAEKMLADKMKKAGLSKDEETTIDEPSSNTGKFFKGIATSVKGFSTNLEQNAIDLVDGKKDISGRISELGKGTKEYITGKKDLSNLNFSTEASDDFNPLAPIKVKRSLLTDFKTGKDFVSGIHSVSDVKDILESTDKYKTIESKINAVKKMAEESENPKEFVESFKKTDEYKKLSASSKATIDKVSGTISTVGKAIKEDVENTKTFKAAETVVAKGKKLASDVVNSEPIKKITESKIVTNAIEDLDGIKTKVTNLANLSDMSTVVEELWVKVESKIEELEALDKNDVLDKRIEALRKLSSDIEKFEVDENNINESRKTVLGFIATLTKLLSSAIATDVKDTVVSKVSPIGKKISHVTNKYTFKKPTFDKKDTDTEEVSKKVDKKTSKQVYKPKPSSKYIKKEAGELVPGKPTIIAGKASSYKSAVVPDRKPTFDFSDSNAKQAIIDKLKFTKGGQYKFSSSADVEQLKDILKLPAIPVKIVRLLLDFNFIGTIGSDSTMPASFSAAFVKEVPGLKDDYLFLITKQTLDMAEVNPEVLIEMIAHEHEHLVQTADGRLSFPQQDDSIAGHYYSEIDFDRDKFKTATHLIPFKHYLDSPWEAEAYKEGYSNVYDYYLENGTIPETMTREEFIKQAQDTNFKQIRDQNKEVLKQYEGLFKQNNAPWYYDKEGDIDYDKIPSLKALTESPTSFTYESPNGPDDGVVDVNEEQVDIDADPKVAAGIKVDRKETLKDKLSKQKDKLVNTGKDLSKKVTSNKTVDKLLHKDKDLTKMSFSAEDSGFNKLAPVKRENRIDSFIQTTKDTVKDTKDTVANSKVYKDSIEKIKYIETFLSNKVDKIVTPDVKRTVVDKIDSYVLDKMTALGKIDTDDKRKTHDGLQSARDKLKAIDVDKSTTKDFIKSTKSVYSDINKFGPNEFKELVSNIKTKSLDKITKFKGKVEDNVTINNIKDDVVERATDVKEFVDNNETVKNIKTSVSNVVKANNIKDSKAGKLIKKHIPKSFTDSIANIKSTVFDAPKDERVHEFDVSEEDKTEQQELKDILFKLTDSSDSDSLRLNLKIYLEKANKEIDKVSDFISKDKERELKFRGRVDKLKNISEKLFNIDINESSTIKDLSKELNEGLGTLISDVMPSKFKTSSGPTKEEEDKAKEESKEDSLLDILDSDNPIDALQSKIKNAVKSKIKGLLKSGVKGAFNLGKGIIQRDIERGKKLRAFLKKKLFDKKDGSPGFVKTKLNKGLNFAGKVLRKGKDLASDINDKGINVVKADIRNGERLRGMLFKGKSKDSETKHEEAKSTVEPIVKISSATKDEKVKEISDNAKGIAKKKKPIKSKKPHKQKRGKIDPSTIIYTRGEHGQRVLKKTSVAGSSNKLSASADRDGDGRRDGSWLDKVSKTKDDKVKASKKTKQVKGISGSANVVKSAFDRDGSGRRDGSWLDRLKKKKDAVVGGAKGIIAKAKEEGSSWLPALLLGVTAFFKPLLSKLISGVVDLGSYIVKGIGKAFKSVGNFLLDGIKSVFGKLGEVLMKPITAVKDFVMKGVDKAKAVAGKALDAAKNAGSKVLEVAKNSKAGKFVANVASKAKNAVVSGGSKLLNVVKNSKVGGVVAKVAKKIPTEGILKLLKSFKGLIFKKLGKKAGATVAAKLAGKVASRIVPFAGAAMLAYDAAKIGYDVFHNGTSLKSAISKQILGFDLFSKDDVPKDEDGNPIKPDEQEPNSSKDKKDNVSKVEAVVKKKVKQAGFIDVDGKKVRVSTKQMAMIKGLMDKGESQKALMLLNTLKEQQYKDKNNDAKNKALEEENSKIDEFNSKIDENKTNSKKVAKKKEVKSKKINKVISILKKDKKRLHKKLDMLVVDKMSNYAKRSKMEEINNCLNIVSKLRTEILHNYNIDDSDDVKELVKIYGKDYKRTLGKDLEDTLSGIDKGSKEIHTEDVVKGKKLKELAKDIAEEKNVGKDKKEDTGILSKAKDSIMSFFGFGNKKEEPKATAPNIDTASTNSGAVKGGKIAKLKPMTATDSDLISDLKRDEGVVLHTYKDHLGYKTIGTGHLTDERKGGIPLRKIIGVDKDNITMDENDTILKYDIDRTSKEVESKIPWLKKKPEPVKKSIINMAFNLGTNGLLKFKNTLKHVKNDEYDKAAHGMLNSKWARQVGKRATRIASTVASADYASSKPANNKVTENHSVFNTDKAISKSRKVVPVANNVTYKPKPKTDVKHTAKVESVSAPVSATNTSIGKTITKTTTKMKDPAKTLAVESNKKLSAVGEVSDKSLSELRTLNKTMTDSLDIQRQTLEAMTQMLHLNHDMHNRSLSMEKDIVDVEVSKTKKITPPQIESMPKPAMGLEKRSFAS